MAIPEPRLGASHCLLNCPRCGLSIRMRAWWLAIEYCPRCIARARVAVKLFSSGLPAAELYADGLVPQADDGTVDHGLPEPAR